VMAPEHSHSSENETGERVCSYEPAFKLTSVGFCVQPPPPPLAAFSG
jgi:hypothetical protein